MQRHNVLVLVGIVAIGLGAIVGSGALTQVSADRTATVSVTGDGAALVGFGANTTSGIVSNTSDAKAIRLGVDGLNDDATTTLPVLDVSNNADTSLRVNASTDVDYVDARMSGGSAVDLASGDTAVVHFEIDATHSNFTDGGDIGVTIQADSSRTGTSTAQ
ncbi:hypothetical protein [Halomicrobium urmianum]|uniref:hypothetical protein n=1 Tax=Halomicrobium urmianum TaxID=1586233 RepID=UPI001CD97666|nr:hypothetical protein [Halomicrobium urmianum]